MRRPGAVHAELFVVILGNQLPFETLAVSVEQSLKRAAHSALMVEFEVSKLMQGFVVALDQPVGRTDIQRPIEKNVSSSLA